MGLVPYTAGKRRTLTPIRQSVSDGSTLSLDFTTGVLDPRLTFTRSTTGTFINSSGYVTSAAINAPRFGYDPTTLAPRGLLIEGSASNLLSYSEDFSNAAWTKSNTNGSMTLTGTAPDNTATSRLLEENTTSYAKHSLERSISISAGIHTFSVWLKEPTSNSRRYAHIQLADGQGTAARYTIVADLQTGTITASGVNNGSLVGSPTGTGHSITAYPNGWYRVTISMNHVSSPSYPTIMLGDTATLFGGNNQPFYSATAPYKGLIVWGAQFETGSAASSYIPTGASTGNRANDFAAISGSNFTSWFTGGTSGTFYADWYGGVRGVASNVRSVLATTDLTTRHLHMYQISPTGALRVADYNGSNSATTGNSLNSGARTQGAFSFAYPGSGTTSTVNVCLNGETVASSSTMAFSVAPTFLSLGLPSANGTSTSSADGILNNSIRSIKYWPTVLPNSELQNITTPGDTSTLTLDFTNGTLDPRVSFSRAGGGTYVGPDGFIYGIDSATSASLAIGTGSKSVTLTATAGTNRRFEVGQTVYFSNGANNMSGAVTAYSPSTQVITINATATSGSGSFTSWVVGNASPRFDYNPATLSPRGLVIEGAKDNICLQSENFGTWLKAQAADVVTANAGLSPDGQQNAYKISPSSVSGAHGIYRPTTVNVSTTYTHSVYVKAAELNWVYLTEANTLTATAWFDLATGTVGTISGTGSPAAYMQNAGNGWWRCVFMFTTTGSQTIANIQVRPTTGNNVFTGYVGNGVDGIYAWGAQAEAYTLSSYIPTDASQRSRVTDSCSMIGTNFSSWFNPFEGTFTTIFETAYAGKTLQSAYVLAFDSSASKRIVYLNTDLDTVASFDGTTIVSPTGDATGAVVNVASAYSATDRAVVLNGGTVATGTIAGTYTTATSLGIGASVPFVTIKQIKYYPTRLTNAQMQGLTT